MSTDMFPQPFIDLMLKEGPVPEKIDVTQHLGLAHLACKPYKASLNRGFDYTDMFQAACMGLMRAAETYSPERGKFSTYAVPLAKRYVKRLVATQARVVKVPQYVQDEAAKAGRPKTAPAPKTRARRTSGGAFDWDAPGASASTGVPLIGELWRGAYEGPPEAWTPPAHTEVHYPSAEYSLDAPTGEDWIGSMHDVLCDQAQQDPEALALAREFSPDNSSLQACLRELNPDQRFVIQSRLNGSTQPEIAGLMGVSKQRVGQIQDSAVAKLRELIQAGA